MIDVHTHFCPGTHLQFHRGPKHLYLCPGTRLRFHRGPNVEWQDAEALDSDEEDSDIGEEMADYRKVPTESFTYITAPLVGTGTCTQTYSVH